MATPNFLRAQPDGVLLSVKLQPRASANEIGGPLGAELRIKVTAPPVDAAANEAWFNCSLTGWIAPVVVSNWCAATNRGTRWSNSTASPRKKCFKSFWNQQRIDFSVNFPAPLATHAVI